MPIDLLFARWKALPIAARRWVGILLGFASCAALFATVVARTPQVALFATPLHAEQLREVEDRLASWNVPFTPTSQNVSVAEQSRSGLLLQLSLAGVPHAHLSTSSETLANVGVLTPQSVIDAQERGGLADDIARSLRGIGGIDDARVIIAPARAMQFADQTAQDASASVRLRMHPGSLLAPQAIAGIRSFVAASVAGLLPARVTLLDDRGVALDASMAASDSSELQVALQSALDVAFGAGMSIVRVHTETDPVAIERSQVRRAPISSSTPITNVASSENYDAGTKHYAKQSQQNDRGSETLASSERAEPGRLARISTAVFVDRSQAVELANVRELAAATVGFDARRGDRLAVVAVDLHHPRPPTHDGWWLLYGALVPLLPALALTVGAIVVAKIAVRPMLSAVRRAIGRAGLARPSQAVAGCTPASVRGALAHEPPHAAAAIISALPAATAAAVLDLYPAHERDAIIQRMQRANSPLIPSAAEVLSRHA